MTSPETSPSSVNGTTSGVSYGPPKRPLGLKRQFLHAASLEFTAPSGQVLRLSSPLPADLQKVLDALEVQEAAA